MSGGPGVHAGGHADGSMLEMSMSMSMSTSSGGIMPTGPWDAWCLATWYTAIITAAAVAAGARRSRTGAAWFSRRVRVPLLRHGASVGELLLVGLYVLTLCISFTDQYILMTGTLTDPGDATTLSIVLVARSLGHAVEASLAFTMLPVARGSVWLRALGVSFERALRWHRVVARITLAGFTLHMVLWWSSWARNGTWLANAVYSNGYVASAGGLGNFTIPYIEVTWIVAACTAAFTWERIRRARFELFYVTHALMIVVVGMACFHSWYSTGYLVWIMIVPGAMYVYDRVARHAAGRRFARICALVPEPGVTRVEYEIADLRAYAPGQFAFLNIPALGEIEWHPFSISSAPPAVVVTGESEVVRLSHHIKDMGPGTWTHKLHELAIAVETGQVRAADIDLRVDGPYGRAPCGPDGDDGAGGAYDAVVLVAGGIGATPLLSMWQAARAYGRGGTRWTFLWTVRQPTMFAALSGALEGAESARENAVEGDRFTSMLYCTYGGSGGLHETSTSGSTERTPLAPAAEPTQMASMLNRDSVVAGRPNIAAVVRAAAERAVGDAAAGGSERARVLVWACGPPAMLAAARDACDTVRSGQTDVQFADCVFMW